MNDRGSFTLGKKIQNLQTFWQPSATFISIYQYDIWMCYIFEAVLSELTLRNIERMHGSHPLYCNSLAGTYVYELQNSCKSSWVIVEPLLGNVNFLLN